MTSIVTWVIQHSPLFYWTQSLWRDEAFAILLAKHSTSEIIQLSANDFNPPLHYLILHYWMIVFGTSEIATRSLSLAFYTGLIVVVYILAKMWFPRGIWSKLIALIAALSPMLMHYAFEVRMYSLFAFLAALSTLALYKRNWYLYVISTTLGLYTHSFMPLFLFSHGIYIVIKTLAQKNFVPLKQFGIRLGIIMLFYLPWFPILLSQWLKSHESWIYPIDRQLVLSVLGNLLTGYEGTPGGWWVGTALLSLIIALFTFLAIRKKYHDIEGIVLWGFIPLALVLGVSVVKPIYVNRYLIPVTVALVMLIGMGINAMSTKWIRVSCVSGIILLFLTINIVRPGATQKLDLRSVYQRLNKSSEANAWIITDPLVYFEGMYYFNDPTRVYIYKPVGGYIPSYVGIAVIPGEKIITVLPTDRPVYFVNQSGHVRTTTMP